MPQQGTVQIRAAIVDLAVAAVWFSKYDPRGGILLPNGDPKTRARARQVAKVLFSRAKRKRRQHLLSLGVISLKRDDACWIAQHGRSLSAPYWVRILATQCFDAVSKKPGHPALTLEEVQARVDGKVSVEDRHRKRLRRRWLDRQRWADLTHDSPTLGALLFRAASEKCLN